MASSCIIQKFEEGWENFGRCLEIQKNIALDKIICYRPHGGRLSCVLIFLGNITFLKWSALGVILVWDEDRLAF